MNIHRYAGCAMGLSIALTLSAPAEAKAQTDSTRRATSEQRIPVRKETRTGQTSGQTSGQTTAQATVTRRESGGEVRLSAAAITAARIDSLEAVAATYGSRIDALEATNATLNTRLEATDRTIAALTDSLRMVRGELTAARAELSTVRSELSLTTARTAVLADSVRWMNQRWNRFLNGSVFGNSGFYVGLGTGALHLTLPIGWSKVGNMIGFRGELSYQRLEGRLRGSFTNPDPKVYSAVGMVTVNLPINTAKNNLVYLMGGGGAYQFHHIGASSSLAGSFNGTSSSETKFGMTAGAGLEVHILGATSLFTQTSFTTVSADRGGRLNWIPLLVGVQLR